MFTKQHYERIASEIYNTRWIDHPVRLKPYIDMNELVDRLVGYFKLDNPRFNEEKFRSACVGK